jgi:hypothetical protein
MTTARPDLHALDAVVSSTILDAMRVASARLAQLGVRHALVGGLAVGAHGFPRATKVVDFLVGDEAFEHHPGGIVALKAGIPIQVGGVLVDLLSVQPDEGALHEVPVAPASGEVPLAPVEAIVHLKLKSPRMKDATDVVELLKAGVDAARCRAWLTANAPPLLARFETLVQRAEEESR